jgi:hypothetical protein
LLSYAGIFSKHMAEQEVIKHTKKVYKIWTSDEHSFWHKVKEFFLEIVIIVFAVSLSIWFHEWSEHNHQQKEVKEFLIGLRNDLQHDIKEMEQDKASFYLSRNAFNYIFSSRYGQTLRQDSLTKHRNWMFNHTGLNVNNGRYEGFKSAGKIGNIEDRVLQNDILDLYQEDVKALVAYTDYYTSLKMRLSDYYNTNVHRTSDTTNNTTVVLASDQVRNLSQDLKNVRGIVELYDRCINKSREIIRKIDEDYKQD